MRRSILLSLVILFSLACVGLTFFSFSPLRVSGQPYLRSLNDFLLLLSTDAQRFVSASPPPFSDDAYRKLIDRVGPKTHPWVKKSILWQLGRWQEEAAPALIADLYTAPDRHRLLIAAQVLGQIRHEEGVQAIALVLEGLDQDPRDVPMLREQLITVLGDSGVTAAADTLGRYYHPSRPERTRLLEALGKLGQTDILLNEYHSESDRKRKDDLIWPLAYTRDPEAMRVVAGLLLHADHHIRVRARSALDQAAPGAAVDAALDLLQTTEDEYVYSAVMQTLFATRHAAENPRVVSFLAGYLDHPALAWEANYALGRIGSEEALAILRARVASLPFEEALVSLDALQADAVPLLAGYLRHADPGVRQRAIWKLQALLVPATGPLVAPLVNDPDRWVQRAARETLMTTDKVLLFRSFVDHLPEKIQPSVWYGFRSEMDWGFRKGFQWGLDIFTWVHMLGTGLSLILGLLLLFNQLRIFEPYRFNLFLQFLLVEGFIGDFFFMDHGIGDPWHLYLAATGIHLLLLIGFLCQERDRVPGELRNRFERFGGASLWLIAPLLLCFGTPLLAESLRQGFRDFMTLLPFIALLGITACLVIEQWALPWNLLPRAARLERVMSGLFSAALLTMIAAVVVRYARQQPAAGNLDGTVFIALLLLPLFWLLLLHLYQIGLFRRGVYYALAPPPNSRLEVVQDGERISLRRRPARQRLANKILPLVWVCSAGLGAAALAGQSGHAPGMVLAILVAPIGAAVAGLALEGLRLRTIVQIRRGYLRVGASRLGGVIIGGAWSRHVPLNLLQGKLALEKPELDWLVGLQRISTGRVKPQEDQLPELSLQGEVRWRNAKDPAAGLDLTLTMVNRGHRAVSPADFDHRAGQLAWQADVNGRRGDVGFCRRDREGPIPPNAVKTVNVRIFPDEDTLPVAGGSLILTCLRGGSLTLSLPALETGEFDG